MFRFNSTLVQLNVEDLPDWEDLQSFNSTLVQLNVSAKSLFNTLKSRFNSTLVQLNEDTADEFTATYARFNSTLVQLNVFPAGFTMQGITMFQFHIGSIKCFLAAALNVFRLGFNSTLVQLNADRKEKYARPRDCFNSTLVQLNVGKLRLDSAFPSFNSTLVQLNEQELFKQ